MKVLAINGSARKDSNTAIMVRKALAELDKEGIETELIQLADHKVRGCLACYKCMDNLDRRCAVRNDDLNDIMAAMLAADGIILASPTYIADVTAQIKALMDRTGLVGRVNGGLWRRKVGACVTVARRGGAIHAFDTMNHWFSMAEMILVGSDYWNMGFGRATGDVEGDEEGLSTMSILGRNMAWLLKRIHRQDAPRVPTRPEEC